MYKVIVLAYDGCRESQRALNEGAEIAIRYAAACHLLAVMRLPLGVSVGEGFDAESMVNDEQQHYRQVLDEGAARLRERGLKVTGHLRRGEAVNEIAALAREVACDLIVVGHRNRSGVARWWHTPIGATLLEQAPCSVLVAANEPPAPGEKK